MRYTVSSLSKLAGISVRTLHYYDQIGLLTPSYQAENGYRYYEEKELLRLQQILFYKELDFPLDQIKLMLDAPNFDPTKALEDHKKLLELKRDRLEAMLRTVDVTIQKLVEDQVMDDSQLFQAMSTKQLDEYKQEAKRRWGQTEAYKQSIERTKHFTKVDNERVQREWHDLMTRATALVDQDIESEAVQTLVKDWHTHINQFYDCSYEMLQGLGQMYTQDKRFEKNFQQYHPDLPAFLTRAIDYYCSSIS